MFIDRLMELIRQKGISKNKLLTDLGLNHNAFAKWNRPGCTPTGATLTKIASYFNVSCDYLLGHTEDAGNDGVWELRRQLAERPEMKVLFSLAKSAAREDIQLASDLLARFAKESEG
jgi:transcriptional regulator with XRE-family HTH domain